MIRIQTYVEGLLREVQQLISLAEKGVESNHEERFAILFETLNDGCGEDGIHRVFVRQPDYNYAKTRYFISHARRRR